MATATSDIDLFSDDVLQNTASHYRTLRDLGAIVHLPSSELYAITRYDAVRAALRADNILINGEGVAANDLINSTRSEATLISDGETHIRRKQILIRPLMPKSLNDIRGRVGETADKLIRDLKAGDEFCGVSAFAAHLPLSIVAELVGLDEDGRENMLVWAAATFDALGPMNDRTMAALATALGLREYIDQLSVDQMRPDGWARRIYAEAEAGTITMGEAKGMVLDYTAPSLDTTILASAQMLWRLGTTDGAFDALKSDPTLIPSVVNESVRLASPIRMFTRLAAEDYVTDEGTIPAGARVAVLYASANWDERHYEGGDTFQVDRNPRDHVGWGHGTHVCAGMHLARLEMEALATALVEHVDRIEIGKPTRILNNILQGFQTIPTQFH